MQLVGTDTDFSLSGYNPNTQLYYRIYSYRSGKETISDVFIASTLPNNPSIPVQQSISKNSLTFSWSYPTYGADGMEARYSDDVGFGTFDDRQFTTSPSIISGLIPNTTYYLKLRCFNETGSSDFSSVLTVLTRPSEPLAEDATNLSANSFTANWTGYGEDGFEIDLLLSSTTLSSVDTGTDEFYTFYDLSSETEYNYKVRAYNASGYSEYSNIIYAETLSA